MKILVCSCDKDDDTFEPFHHCMEKYWHEHPEVIYKTETINNPYYRTITADYPLNKWTDGMRKVIEQVNDEHILLLMDDIFIRRQVDLTRIEQSETIMENNSNIACMNYEQAFDPFDDETDIKGWKKRVHGSPWEVSIMCGLWDKAKLLNVLQDGLSPWEVEAVQNNCGYEFWINSGDYIIDWGYKTYRPSGISRGKWQRECIEFFNKEGIKVDYKRGVNW